jgi:predicted membrane channel-forming protein YqfA (hemolysin III family)
MLAYLLIIAGLVLLIAFPHAFAGAVAVGVILVVAGIVLLLFGVLAYRKVRRMQKDLFGPRKDRKPFDLNDFRF